MEFIVHPLIDSNSLQSSLNHILISQNHKPNSSTHGCIFFAIKSQSIISSDPNVVHIPAVLLTIKWKTPFIFTIKLIFTYIRVSRHSHAVVSLYLQEKSHFCKTIKLLSRHQNLGVCHLHRLKLNFFEGRWCCRQELVLG